MWNTTTGPQRLQGAEARLIRESIAFAAEIIQQKEDGTTSHWFFEVPPFDELQWQQQLVLLAEVGTALLTSAEPQERSAIHEATAAVVYRALLQGIEIEIETDKLAIDDDYLDFDELPTWRELIMDACRQAGIDDLPPPDCSDASEWEMLIDMLSNEVVWDSDWETEELFLDVDPERARAVKQTLGIDDDYFVAVAPDPDESAVQRARDSLRELLTAETS